MKAKAYEPRTLTAERGRTRSIIGFHYPLGLTSILMASTFAVVSFGLAQTPDPALALAAFAIAQSVTNFFVSPLFSVRNLLIAVGTNEDSMANAIRVVFWVAIGLFVWLLVVSFTRVGHIIFIDLFGAPIELFGDILAVVRLCLSLPVIYSFRAWAQAILILKRQTPYLILAMGMRLLVMLPLAIVLPGFEMLSSPAVGAIIWIVGLSVEAVICCLCAVWSRADIGGRGVLGKVDSLGDCARFLAPLALHGFLGSLTFPAINAGLARTLNPEISLAAFQLAWSLAFFFVAFVQPNISQTVLVFLENRQWWESLRRVAIKITVVTSVALLLFVFTGLARIVLVSLMNVSDDLVGPAILVLLISVPITFFAGVGDLWAGAALHERKTLMLVFAKIADVVGVVLTAFVLSWIIPSWDAAIAPAALLIGVALNYLVLRRLVNPVVKNLMP